MKEPQQSVGSHKFTLYKQPLTPYWTMRVMVNGRRRGFSTRETNKRQAEQKARVIMADIQSRGFDEAVALHSPRKSVTEVKNESYSRPSCKNIITLYKEACAIWDTAPAPSTAARYIRCFEQIYTFAKVTYLGDITEDSIERFRKSYLLKATKKGRELRSARLSMNSILRNASAIFAKKALREYKRWGYTVTNPFADITPSKIPKSSYTPLDRKIVEQLWTKALLLRDGDPNATAPKSTLRKRIRFDFREPNPEAYLLLLLELGLGLRRNEADKAQWNWFYERDGRQYIQVRETKCFRPKSGESRNIPVAQDIWKLLQYKRDPDALFIVPGMEPKTLKEQAQLISASYRCDYDHRHLSSWLRSMGVEDQKPCHRLRKEFGSYIATQFGLFHAQRMLGHSSPTVTADHYAGLTDLPDINPTNMGGNR